MILASTESEYPRLYENLLDRICTLTVIGVVIVGAVSSYKSAIEHVKIVEPLTLMSGARVELHEYRAMNGSWPDRNAWLPSGVDNEKSVPPGQYVAEVTAAAGGTLNFFMDTPAIGGRGRLLSIRGATLPGVAGSPIIWVCGYAAMPPRFQAEARNTTDIDAARLPAACRGPIEHRAASG